MVSLSELSERCIESAMESAVFAYNTAIDAMVEVISSDSSTRGIVARHVCETQVAFELARQSFLLGMYVSEEGRGIDDDALPNYIGMFFGAMITAAFIMLVDGKRYDSMSDVSDGFSNLVSMVCDGSLGILHDAISDDCQLSELLEQYRKRKEGAE